MQEMTPQDFKKTIEALLGFGAQRQFARIIGSDETTVRRWVSGARKLPPYVPLVIALLWERKSAGRGLEVNIERALAEIHSTDELNDAKRVLGLG